MRMWAMSIAVLLGCPGTGPNDDDDAVDDDDDGFGGGTLQWVRGWGAGATDGGTVVTTSEDDRVFVGGGYHGLANLEDGGPRIQDGSDPGGFVARYTPDGDALWAVTIQRPSDYDSDWVMPTHLAPTDDGVVALGLGGGPEAGFAFLSNDPAHNLSVNGNGSWLAWWDDDGDLQQVLMLSRPLEDDETAAQFGPVPCGLVDDGEGGVIVALTTPEGLSLVEPDGTEIPICAWEGWPVNDADADFALLRFSASGEGGRRPARVGREYAWNPPARRRPPQPPRPDGAAARPLAGPTGPSSTVKSYFRSARAYQPRGSPWSSLS